MIYAVFYYGNAFAIFQLKSINFNLIITLRKKKMGCWYHILSDLSHEIDKKHVLNVLWSAVLLLSPYFSISKIIFFWYQETIFYIK